MIFRRRQRLPVYQIDPDEILLDARNLPSFNTQQFEGRLEKPITKNAFYALGLLTVIIGAVFLIKVGQLQLVNGQTLSARSASNTLRRIPVFAERGLITDRNGVNLAWNTPATTTERSYIQTAGFGHLLGYIGYPNEKEIKNSEVNPEAQIGRDGVERIFDSSLRGENGIKIEEVDVTGKVKSDSVLQPPVTGKNLILSVDSRVQSELYQAIKGLIDQKLFVAGAGVIMDVRTGEILAMTSVPEYDPNILAAGDDRPTISSYLNDKRQPFLNRVIDGLYTPGSIVKPIMALGALQEGVIDPETKILSTGSISLPNPFDPSQPSVFRDWRAQGWVDLRQALAVSSDVYFYEVGGGYENQRGMGIANIDKYAQLFGLGQATGIDFLTEATGVIPTPAWKAKVFNGEAWRIGDTYHTVIGQYGFQVTPLQIVKADAAIASNGRLVTPTVLKSPELTTASSTQITAIDPRYYQIVREGMRQSVLSGVASGLNVPGFKVAGKTGTAELGITKNYVNSWVTGFFPYESPRYAFAVVMEKGDRTNLIGATYAMRQVLDWLSANAPEYTTVDPDPKTR